MNFDLSTIMHLAWSTARVAKYKFGGKAVQYFSLSLKYAWSRTKANKLAKEKAAAGQKNKAQRIQKTTSEIAAIKDWFVRKNFTANEAYVIETNDWIEVVEETAKAFKLVVHNADLGNINTWAPKSCCVA